MNLQSRNPNKLKSIKNVEILDKINLSEHLG